MEYRINERNRPLGVRQNGLFLFFFGTGYDRIHILKIEEFR